MSALFVTPSVGKRAARRAGDWVPAIAVFVLAIVVWEGAISVFHVQQFLLPRPSDIVRSFWNDRHTLWPAGWTTFKEALGGFFLLDPDNLDDAIAMAARTSTCAPSGRTSCSARPYTRARGRRRPSA